MASALDPVCDFDWAAHWRGLVERREADAARAPQSDFWERIARSYKRDIGARPDPLLELVEPYLSPRTTLIDVGAGTGRHSVALASRLDWVTAVEPSLAMREQIEDVPNLTVIASSWEDAEPAPADLVICHHVLYGVMEPVPFIEKLQASARERVFIALREGEPNHPATALREQLAGRRPRMPRFQDLFNLLRQLRIAPSVTYFTYEWVQRYDDLDQAAGDCANRLGGAWDERRGRAWLEANLRAGPDGSLLYDGGPVTSGVADWKPRN